MTVPEARVVSSSGRVLPGWRAVLMVLEHYWRWYRRGWRATAVSSVVQPLLFLVAFGVGFGSLVDARGVGPAGVPYLVYLAPGLLAMSAVQTAAFEATYPVVSGFKWQQVYWAMAATPLTPGQIATGDLAWIGARMLSSGLVYVLVIGLLGGISGPGIVAALLCATLCGLAFGAAVMAFSAGVQDEGSAFSAFFRLVLMPMTLFSGTFFPLDRLPDWVHPLAWATPLWHGTELSRGVALGTLSWAGALGHLGYLLVLLTLGAGLARRRFRRRLNP
jgi:lipooligosaccharide transport system permease protein